jgi:hypothetical protein
LPKKNFQFLHFLLDFFLNYLAWWVAGGNVIFVIEFIPYSFLKVSRACRVAVVSVNRKAKTSSPAYVV